MPLRARIAARAQAPLRSTVATLLLLLVANSPLASAARFSWSIKNVTQCEGIHMSWSNAVGNILVDIIPIQDKENLTDIITLFTPAAFTSPAVIGTSSAAAGSDVLVLAWDGSADHAFPWGGNPFVTTVKASNDYSCLKPNASAQFGFSFAIEGGGSIVDAQNPPNQCDRISIAWTQPVTPPAQIYGFVVGGETFAIWDGKDTDVTSVDWAVNVTAGSQLMIFASDSGGVNRPMGGNTGLMTIGASTDHTCLAGYVNSTGSSADSTSISTSSTSSLGPASTSSSSSAPHRSHPFGLWGFLCILLNAGAIMQI